MKRQKKRSPIKEKVLRNPGQSLDEERQRILDEEISSYFWAAIVFILFTGVEWYRWWRDYPYQPVPYTIFTFAALAFVAYRLRKSIGKLRTLKLGLDGEKAVGQYLDLLRRDGHRIFHDIVGDGFNVDHVIISPRGIFAVETKTYGKPADEKAVIRVEGERVLVDGWEPDRDPIKQVVALADWLQEVLNESTGKRFAVRGILLYPGWWVDGRPQNKRVWVLNPKALPKFLENEPEALSEADTSLVTYHLSRYIRSR